MAKRLLLFVVFCFVFVSFSWGQCDKKYIMNLNNTHTYISTSLEENSNYPKLFACKIDLKIANIETENLNFKWYRNDTLLNEKSAMLKSINGGVFRVEIQNDKCTYSIGDLNVELIKTVP